LTFGCSYLRRDGHLRSLPTRRSSDLGSSDSIKAAVRAGVGCAFFSTTQLADGGFQTRHLEGVDLCRKLSLCWRKDGPFSPPFQLFLDELPFLLSERLS